VLNIPIAQRLDCVVRSGGTVGPMRVARHPRRPLSRVQVAGSSPGRGAK
jgi:hypothetical protein